MQGLLFWYPEDGAHMLLMVGLGNPDEKYQGNRHNIGFRVLDEIAGRYGFGPARVKFQSRLREGVLEAHGCREKALLLQPMTYYNESGQAVREAAQFYKIPAGNVVVFHDELDLAPGKLKVKKGGGAAGNNGLKSITSHIGEDFLRVRMGIGHPGDKSKVTKYVLSDFPKAEQADWVDDLLHACADAAPLFSSTDDGAAKFMSRVALLMKPPVHTPAPGRKPQKDNGETGNPPAAPSQKTEAADESRKDESGPFSALRNLFGTKE